MKLFFVIFSMVIGIALVGFNYYQFNNAEKTVKMIDQASETLNQQGRHRFEIQYFYTRLVNTNVIEPRVFREFETNSFFLDGHEAPEAVPKNYDPEKRETLADKRKQMNKLKADYQEIPFEQQSREDNLVSLYLWSTAVVDLLDEVQALDIQLSRFLSNQLVLRLRSTVFTNALGLLAAFTVLFIAFFLSNRKQVQQVQHASAELESKNRELSASKKVFISLMEDLSAEREAAVETSNNMFVANRQLQHKNEEMEQFIYTVSHDLKTPLVTIGGFAERLRSSLNEDLSDKHLHQLSRISANVTHMEGLLNDLLQLSRIIRQEIDKTEILTEGLLSKVMNALSIDDQSEVIIVSPLPTIFGNERMVFQCFQNLIDNAIRYRHPDRRLKIEINGSKVDNFTQISFVDNGIGIEEKYFEQIFRIFERLDVGEGTGVGLAIVKTVMEKHSGVVTVTSQFGHGSTFTLQFPLT